MSDRWKFDHRVITEMAATTDLFTVEAYATAADIRLRRLAHPDMTPRAYTVTYHVPTLIGEGKGRGEFAPRTEMSIDLATPGYPLSPPNVVVISPHMPYSPHFRIGSPVCIGSEIWGDRRGHVTLGHLVIHLAKLLNWDEEMRGGGYVGWNAAAIAFHKRVFKSQPLNPDLVYPGLPKFLTAKRTRSFTPKSDSSADAGRFAPR